MFLTLPGTYEALVRRWLPHHIVFQREYVSTNGHAALHTRNRFLKWISKNRSRVLSPPTHSDFRYADNIYYCTKNQATVSSV